MMAVIRQGPGDTVDWEVVHKPQVIDQIMGAIAMVLA
jgi:hypothetical protein